MIPSMVFSGYHSKLERVLHTIFSSIIFCLKPSGCRSVGMMSSSDASYGLQLCNVWANIFLPKKCLRFGHTNCRKAAYAFIDFFSSKADQFLMEFFSRLQGSAFESILMLNFLVQSVSSISGLNLYKKLGNNQ